MRKSVASAHGFFDSLIRKTPTKGTNVASLDGLRGLAVLIVLTAHTNVLNNSNRGGVGVIVFFVLSAFLLTLPFAEIPYRPLSARSLLVYLRRRLLRIYPMYFLTLFLSFYPLAGVIRQDVPYASAGQRFRFFFEFATFQITGGHLWTVTQEVYFYLLLPLVLVLRLQRRTVFAGLLIAVALGWSFVRVQSWAPTLSHNPDLVEARLPLLFDLFLVGVASAFLLAGRSPRPGKGTAATVVGFSIAVFLVGANEPTVEAIRRFSPTLSSALLKANDPFAVALLSALLLALLVLYEKSLLAGVFRLKALRLIGVVSYSLYLLHPHVIEMARLHNLPLPGGEAPRFLVVFLISFVLSVLTYVGIERPFLRLGATRAKAREQV